jgi:hypothetical protein
MGEELTALTEEGGPQAGGLSDEQAYSRDPVLIPGIEAHIAKLQALGAPRGDRAQVEAMLAALQEDLEAGTADDISTFEQFSSQFDRFDRLAQAYGLDGCAFV